jgi:hypothetical protein
MHENTCAKLCLLNFNENKLLQVFFFNLKYKHFLNVS